MSECKCSLSIRVVGDGCRYCQPQNYIDTLSDIIDDEREANASLEERITELETKIDPVNRCAADIHLIEGLGYCSVTLKMKKECECPDCGRTLVDYKG